MPAEPSVKGTVFRGVAEDVKRLREEGRLRDAELESELPAGDRAVLEDKLLDAAWYSMATYARLLDLLCRREGGGSLRYYRDRGARNAERLIQAGLYSQLSFLGRFQEEASRTASASPASFVESYRSNLRRVVSMAGSIYSTGRWSVEVDPDDSERIAIRIDEAQPYSEGMRYAIEGFLNACARAVRPDLQRLFETERPTRDRIRIRMTRRIPELYASAEASAGR